MHLTSRGARKGVVTQDQPSGIWWSFDQYVQDGVAIQLRLLRRAAEDGLHIVSDEEGTDAPTLYGRLGSYQNRMGALLLLERLGPEAERDCIGPLGNIGNNGKGLG